MDTITDNKIYIRSENITLTDSGIFVNLNGFDHVFVPAIFSDGDGCFISVSPSEWSEIIPKCSGCGKPIWNGTCDNPGCGRYGK